MMRVCALFIFVIAAASFAHAQATRTWVSGVGDDANPCSRTAPCKTFAGAISKTAAGGEISALDPAGFGTVTITKSIIINGGGELAGISAGLANAIIINAGANDVVTLKNLDINGQGNGLSGIRYLAGKAVHVEHTWIGGFTNYGIDASMSDNGQLFTDDVIIKQCGNGIRLTTSNNFVFAMLNNTKLISITGDGVQVQTGGRATIRESVISMNGGSGVSVDAALGNGAVNIESTVIDKNNIGLSMSAPYTTAQLSNATIINNNTGINNFANLATVISFGNNHIYANANNGAPTTNVGQQ